jgi:hypothetical protein
MGSVGERSLTHNFTESLKKSHAAEDHPVWRDIYKQAFPDFAGMVNHRSDGPHQRAGIDRSIILRNSKQLLIDEKARYRNEITGRVYDDILLEVWSDEQRRIPGWVCKPLLADYIAYAILPLGKCYLLPVIQMQAAWKKHGHEWMQQSREVRAKNNGWVTVSCPVEPKVLFPAIGACLRVCFDPVEALAWTA